MDKKWFSLLAVELGKIPESEPFTVDDLKRAYALINLTLPQRYILAQINKVSEEKALTVICSPEKQHDVECVAAARKAPTKVITNPHIPDGQNVYVCETPIINISPRPLIDRVAQYNPLFKEFMRQHGWGVKKNDGSN